MSNIHHMAGHTDATKHVIFIHGLNGDYRKTWLGGESKEEFWPEWLTEPSQDVCIWSVAYPSKVAYFFNDEMAFKDRAANIAELLFI
ncbi:hypothetical protein, partial [Chimaeribacter arupi]|uniref:hypothetical protein n=1 Tax=Chimaeribacter arupi TaxID=2060066 RepID=UPI000CB87312